MSIRYLFVASIFSLAVQSEGVDVNLKCKGPSFTPKQEKTPRVQQALKTLEKLAGRRFEDDDDKPDGYNYKIGVCENADDTLFKGQYAAVIQTKKVDDPDPRVIGRYNETFIVSGNDYIMLEYHGGEHYHSHCNNTRKKAIVMFICDQSALEGHGQVIEENNIGQDGCYYLFEYTTNLVCSSQEPRIAGLSMGSVLVIVFFTLVAVYLLVGFLYQRFVVGAKGMEQIPNYGFWQDFGNLQADGCGLICRSGSKPDARMYKGIGDDQLQNEEEEDNTDDHLLPM